MTKLERDLVYVKREFVRVFLRFFQEDFTCTLIILFLESYLHVHAKLR